MEDVGQLGARGQPAPADVVAGESEEARAHHEEDRQEVAALAGLEAAADAGADAGRRRLLLDRLPVVVGGGGRASRARLIAPVRAVLPAVAERRRRDADARARAPELARPAAGRLVLALAALRRPVAHPRVVCNYVRRH